MDDSHEHEYSRKKKRSSDRESAVSRSGRDIGPPPRIKNKRRRNAAIKSLRYFLVKYFPETIYLALSKDHEKAIKRIESAVKNGGRFAFAMPRGSGKTTFTELAVLWAILTGRRKFIAIIGSDKPSSIEILDSIKTELETNDLLFEDFPEACHPIRALEGEARKCTGQHIEGVRTRIGWGADELVFPVVEGALSSESVIRVAGITGRIRGMKYKTTKGKTLRPDLAIVDDPQTEESAYSDPQCNSRERAIKRAVCRLSGPGKDIAVFMPCTVIRKGDLADRFLDKKLNPDWNGLRTKMLYEFPANMDLWEKYDDLRRQELEEDREPVESRKFYIANLKKMKRKAMVGWEERKKAGDVDALQHAMDLYFEDPAGFLAEFNNDPQDELVEGQVEIATPESIMQRTNGYDRGKVPSWATKITAFVDVQQDCLFWLVAAWSDDFRGAVIDYGCFPDQGRTYFTKADIRKTLRKVLKVKSKQGAIRKGLDLLVKELMERQFPTEDGGVMPIDRLAVDASYEQTVIYSFCRAFGDSRVTPHHGKYYGPESKPLAQHKPKAGEKIGHHWLRPSIRGQRLAVRHYASDVNFWKSFIHSRFSIEQGAYGDLTLFGKTRDQRYHRMFADHQCAQKCILMEAKGIRTSEVWKRQPGKDHDWFDCMVGAAVLACVEGSSLPEWNKKERRRRTRDKATAGMSMAERRARKRRQKV